MLVQWILGSSWCTTLFLEDEGIDTTNKPPRLLDLNPTELLWDFMFLSIQHHQIAPQTVHNLSDVLLYIWEEIPQDTVHHVRNTMLSSMHTCMWGPHKLLSTILSCCNENSAKWTSLPHHFFTLSFRASLIPALGRLIILICISFLTHYPVHTSIDIQHDF